MEGERDDIGGDLVRAGGQCPSEAVRPSGVLRGRRSCSRGTARHPARRPAGTRIATPLPVKERGFPARWAGAVNTRTPAAKGAVAPTHARRTAP